ncbi:MAG: Asp-tRNA(Asn)/Glu-tRNA(Gln) amidotransferase subunit GatA [Candidatus Levybacteria bacterium]|nr:Asp-tRNA(Asn)/Glu-tRNA(Gln) amidotransferase subunit GatA [Candidatus Levybacteria bacterium]
MNTPNALTITEALDALKKKQLSSVELTRACLDAIKEKNEELNAFLTVCEDEAIDSARKADEKIKKGNDSPLLGIPIALKDIYMTDGVRTTAGSKVLENYIPQYDATAVSRLKDAGAVIVGKTNLDAWAHGSSGENSDFGPTKNPYNTAYTPGGSSSGSPVALVSDMCLAATGTDTGGSIRLPASFCNVVGLKPTYGRVSRYGIVAMASSLDSIGHFTKTVEDNALFLQVTAGKDPMDATTPPIEVPNYTKSLKDGVKGFKIGVPREYFIEGLDPKIKDLTMKALKTYEEQGAELVDISLSHTEYAIAVYYIIQTAEVSSNLARYDGIRFGNDRSTFGEEAKRRIMLGTYVLSAGYYEAFYKKAMQVRTLLIRDFEETYKKVDVIITPSSPTLPWKLGEKMDDPLKMYLSDIFTVHANLTGHPGLAIPIGFIDPSTRSTGSGQARSGQAGLPVGMQIIGPHFREDLLYQVGYAYEQKNPVWKNKPELT